MLAAVVFAGLLLAVTDSALIGHGNYETALNEIGENGAGETGHKTKEWEQNQGNLLRKWKKENFNEAREDLKYEPSIGDKFLIYQSNDQKCECHRQMCGCCSHTEVPEIHANGTACANVTYQPEDVSMSFTVTFNNQKIYDQSVSVLEAPPACLPLPGQQEGLIVSCLHLSDIEAKGRKLHACVRLEARMLYFPVAYYNLGCFTVGSSAEDERK